MFKTLVSGSILGVMLASPCGSLAQGFPVPPPSSFQLMSFTAMNNLQMSVNSTAMVNRAVTGYGGNRSRASDSRVSGAAGAPQRFSTTFVSAHKATGPEQLAATYPVNSRRQAERVFGEMLAGYGQIEQQFDIPKNDLAGSVSAFLAGSYMAYRNADFPDANFPPLVNQMRQAIASDPRIANATSEEKRELHEQMAILGMFMATTQMALKEHPNAQAAAAAKQAAKGYLEYFLKTDADRIEITGQGLVIR